MSDFKFRPIHKFFKITISSKKYERNTNSDIISLHVYNNTTNKITLPLGLLGYCETNATTSPVKEIAYRVNKILQLLDICQSTILDEELSIDNIISNEKNYRLYHKNPIFQSYIQYHRLYRRTAKIFNYVQFSTFTNNLK